MLLEDAIDIHDRHWKIHWMLNFAQFASTTNLNAVIEEVGADTVADGAAAVQRRGPQLGRDRGSLEGQGGGQGRRRAAGRLRGRDRRPACSTRSSGSERGRRFVAERIATHQQTFGYKSLWSHELHLQALGRGPGADHRGDPRLRGDATTTTRRACSPSATTSRAPSATVMEGVEGEAREKLDGGAAAVA